MAFLWLIKPEEGHIHSPFEVARIHPLTLEFMALIEVAGPARDTGGGGEGEAVGGVELHPGRFTWNPRIHPWKKDKIIFQSIIF